MIKRIIILLACITFFCSPLIHNSYAESTPGRIYRGEIDIEYRNVTVFAPAVASTEDGYVGVISTITVTVQNNGSGRVFVDTSPLTQVDMQGSARLAVKVASTLVENDENTNIDPSAYDYFFVVRTDAPVIGGPSAGATMTVATIALLENWEINEQTIMTGMINPDGSIGPIGGIPQKIDAAYSVGAKRFLIPSGQGTYTELVTTTSGWITTTTPVVRKVSDYVNSKGYDIEVVEVAEVNQAVENFTGYRFTFDGSEDEITTESYLTSMKPLASSLLENASIEYNSSKEIFDGSDIPNTGGFFDNDNYRDYVEEKLDSAKTTLDDSNEWFNQNQYYTSTSKSFQSLIYSRFVKYACEYYDINQSEKAEYIENLLSEVNYIYINTSNNAKNTEINGYITLQSVGAAQRRASDAKNYFDEADGNYRNNNLRTFWDVLYFLDDLSFVVERCNSIGWWIDIGTKFSEVGNLSNSTIENLALEYIEEAQQATTYSSVIVGEISDTSSASTSYLNDATIILQNARNDLENGYSAAAFFGALEATVKANLAIEVIGTDSEEKIELASESSSNNIAKSRKQGLEPILAVSYYEYAESLRNESQYDSALIYYKYSGMIAGAISFTNTSTSSSSSRYVGLPDFKSPLGLSGIINISVIVIFFIFGAIAGLGIGLIITGFSQKKKKKSSEKSKTYVKEAYSMTVRTSYQYPDNQIPKSIRDFYKKNK